MPLLVLPDVAAAEAAARPEPVDEAEELVTQITVATIVTIFALRWQERAALGRNRAVS